MDIPFEGKNPFCCKKLPEDGAEEPKDDESDGESSGASSCGCGSKEGDCKCDEKKVPAQASVLKGTKIVSRLAVRTVRISGWCGRSLSRSSRMRASCRAMAEELARYGAVPPARVNPAPSKGDLMLRLQPPPGGVFDAIPGLTYNSQSAGHPAFGYGFDSDLTAEVGALDESTAELFKPSGTVLCFTKKDPATGYYQSPAGAGSTLQKVADGWIERLADHTQLHYDTAGRLERIVSVSGDTWTLSFENLSGQERLRSVLDPFGRRTTLSYDGSAYLSGLTDAAGRQSQFTVDGQGLLTQYVTPELCVHELELRRAGAAGGVCGPGREPVQLHV